MSGKSDMNSKAEVNDLQTYLDSFNKEIEESNEEFEIELKDVTEGVDVISENSKGHDDDEDVGTYFVDQAGNYYYQANKESVPVLTDPPDNIQQIIYDGDDSANLSNKTEIITYSKKIKNEEEDNKYVFILGDEDKGEKGEGYTTENVYDEEDGELEDFHGEKEVYEFDESEESTPKKSSFLVSTKVVRLRSKSGSGNHIIHQCTHCEYVSNKRYLLARHMKCHSEDRPYKCAVCERGFKTTVSLQNHSNTHIGNKPHRCKSCSSTFTTSGELVRHVRYKHTHEKPHKCFECNYASVELSKLKRHIRCHTGERPYQCPHCTYASPDTFKLKRHLRTHTGEKPYECDICHSKFTQSNSLKAHKMIHSVGDKPVFQCHLCPTTCGRKTDLRIHIQKLHTSERPIICKRCGKMFPDRYSYKVHSKTHEGEKCFKCDICPYASISQRHLDSHLLIHSDHKPFDCQYCEQSFRQKQLLRRHVNLYHNKDYVPPKPQEKTHTCPDCKRAFSRKGNLMRHMAAHDPDSQSNTDKVQLRLGQLDRGCLPPRKTANVTYVNRFNVDQIDEEDYELEEDEHDMEANGLIESTELDDDGEVEGLIEQATEIDIDSNGSPVRIKKENELVTVHDGSGQQYMVVEVIQCEDENELSAAAENDIKNEIDDEFIISELKEEEVNIIKASKGQLSDVQDCFGFDVIMQ